LWSKTLKLNQPVVAVHRLPYSLAFLLSCLFLAASARADDTSSDALMAQLSAHTPEELAEVLDRAEAWSKRFNEYGDRPIAIVLHGNEASVFLKGNYTRYQSIVDQAAKLDAFRVVDIQICERWMGNNGVRRSQLPHFVDTVPYGPGQERALIDAGYQRF